MDELGGGGVARVESEIGFSSQLRLGNGEDVQPDFYPMVEAVDWNNLQIVEMQDEEGRIEMLSEDQMYALLGLRDEDEREEERGRRVLGHRTEQMEDNTDAAIPVSDSMPDEVVIAYDKDHPCMDLGSQYPTMDEFRMALRQFAINEECLERL